MAQPGGVLTRAGHTEAGCDLARLAGLEPAAVIVEIMNDDGTMARRPQLEAFARLHGLRMGTIRDLIRYRLRTERTVERIAERAVQTEFGEFRCICYEDHVHRDLHLALVRGACWDGPSPLVRVHVADTLRDLIGVRRACAPGRCAMRCSASPPSASGVLVILREQESPRALADAIAGPRPRREHAPARRRRVGAAHLRHRRADPQGPRRAPHARALGAQAVAGHLRLRPGSRPSTSAAIQD